MTSNIQPEFGLRISQGPVRTERTLGPSAPGCCSAVLFPAYGSGEITKALVYFSKSVVRQQNVVYVAGQSHNFNHISQQLQLTSQRCKMSFLLHNISFVQG